MNGLDQAVDEYLSVRRAVGFKLAQAERLLHDFASFAETEGAARVTTDLAVRWATQPTQASPGWWASRLCVVRCFARHLAALDPATDVPPLDALPRVPGDARRMTPYLYTPNDIAALMSAASSTRFEFTAIMCRTLIGLLAVTGMRVGEALRLDNQDVDWEHGVLIVRHSKFERSRQVPIHPSALDALRVYVTARDERRIAIRTPSLFISWTGDRLSYGGIRWHFERLARKAGLAPKSARCRPTLHSFRHSFACDTLEDWYRDDADVQARLPLLSTYLGHVDPISTYWYLSPKPGLLAAAADRLEQHMDTER